jgi:hypothetical protein
MKLDMDPDHSLRVISGKAPKKYLGPAVPHRYHEIFFSCDSNKMYVY